MAQETTMSWWRSEDLNPRSLAPECCVWSVVHAASQEWEALPGYPGPRSTGKSCHLALASSHESSVLSPQAEHTSTDGGDQPVRTCVLDCEFIKSGSHV